jgi:hypothetical protein
MPPSHKKQYDNFSAGQKTGGRPVARFVQHLPVSMCAALAVLFVYSEHLPTGSAIGWIRGFSAWRTSIIGCEVPPSPLTISAQTAPVQG